jgi:hypothetical protein
MRFESLHEQMAHGFGPIHWLDLLVGFILLLAFIRESLR